MAWTAPLTAVSNASLTAAQWNASVRDNLLMTAPALATTAGSLFVSTGANALAQRPVLSGTVETAETTTLTSFNDIPSGTIGPSVAPTTGTMGLLMFSVQMNNSLVAGISSSSWEITGASSFPPSDNAAVHFEAANTFQDMRAADVRRLTTLTPGVNTITMKYKVSSGTGQFLRRHIVVIGL